MKIERIEPPIERRPWRRPRCSATCKEQTLRYRHAAQGTKCNWTAHYTVDGVPHCIRHAQELALEHVLSVAAERREVDRNRGCSSAAPVGEAVGDRGTMSEAA